MQQKVKPASPGRGYRRLIPLLLAGILFLPPLSAYAAEGEAGYWERIAHVIAAMDNGGGNEVLTQIEPGEGIPAEILRVLQSRNVTLVILCDGKRIRINGQQMYPVSDSQGSYSWDDLSTIYATPPSPDEVSSAPPLEPSEMESSPETSETASTGAILSHELPPREETPILVAPAPSEQDSSFDTVPESSEQEEYLPISARTEVRRPVYPLLIAGGVILVAAAGGGAAIYFGILRDRIRKKQDELSEESEEDTEDGEEDKEDGKEGKDGNATSPGEPASAPAVSAPAEATAGKS